MLVFPGQSPLSWPCSQQRWRSCGSREDPGHPKLGNPTSAQELRSLFGLATYFRTIIAGSSTIAAPLVAFTSAKATYKFGAAERKAFTALKYALTQAPLLGSPDDSKPYMLVSDASRIACGAVLLQEARPVAFYSYKTNPAEKNCHAGEQGLLAVVKALQHWRHYLEGDVFLTIVTDYKPKCHF